MTTISATENATAVAVAAEDSTTVAAPADSEYTIEQHQQKIKHCKRAEELTPEIKRLFEKYLPHLIEIQKKGFTTLRGVLTDDEIKECRKEFYRWKQSILNFDRINESISSKGMIRQFRAGGTRFAWLIRTNPRVQEFFKDKGQPLDFHQEQDQYVRCGGPVNTQAISMIHDDEWYSSNTYLLQRGLAVSSDEFMVDKMSTGNTPQRFRFFNGLSSWGPGQLRAEMNGTFPYRTSNGWLTMPANRAIVFEYDGEKQWEKALELCTKKLVDTWF